MSKANRDRGEVKINLDKERVLKFDFRALKRLEMDMGVPFMPGKEAAEKIAAAETEDEKTKAAVDATGGFTRKLVTFDGLSIAILCGLQHEEPDITIETVESLMDYAEGGSAMERFTYCTGKVLEAFSAAMGGGQDEEPKKKPVLEVVPEPPPKPGAG